MRQDADPDDVLSVRPITPDDALRQQLFFETMTPENRFKRFFAPKSSLTTSELRGFTHIDYSQSFGLAAVSRRSDQFVGTCRFFGSPGGEVEAAVVVLQSHHGRGVGGLLVDLLFRAAIEEFGASRLHIEHIVSNSAVRHLFDRAAALHSTSCTEGALEDGVRSVTWLLKSAVDVPLNVQEFRTQVVDVTARTRNFEVMRPALHPFSMWRFQLPMRVPFKGTWPTLDVRPVTPEDEPRVKVMLQSIKRLELLVYMKECVVPHLKKDFGSSSIDEVSRFLTHCDFSGGFAVIVMDPYLDTVVAVARWMAMDEHEDDTVSVLLVDEDWHGFGVATFAFDVLVQSAVEEGKRSLTISVPLRQTGASEDSADSLLLSAVKKTLSRHASTVADEMQVHGFVKVVAQLGSSIEKTRLTSVPSLSASQDLDRLQLLERMRSKAKTILTTPSAPVLVCDTCWTDDEEL